ncbi:MAG: cytochrome c family protein [Oligoflexia bacterium]|nr:cytochrome c family protein [Oligoflexia bacterium]
MVFPAIRIRTHLQTVTLFLCAIVAAFFISAKSAQSDEPKFQGVGSCSSSNCHGAQSPRKGSRILQNEYVTWTKHDKHAAAWRVLTEAGGRSIGRNLGIDHPEKAPECLSCHAGGVDPARADPKYTVEDGVGCESCHGASEQWLSAHTALEATFSNNVSLGLSDLTDAKDRASLCLSCHLGDGSREVPHRLYGAGHPRISFELDTFSALMPAHWQVDKDYTDRKGDYQPAHFWLVGLAVQAREAVLRIGRYRSTPHAAHGLPEFSTFNCFSCHHSLESREFERSNYGGKPGEPRLNLSTVELLSAALRGLNNDLAAALDLRLKDIAESEGEILTDNITKLAADLADQTPAIQQLKIDRKVCGKLAANLVGSADKAAKIYYEQAEQVAMGLSALFSGPCGEANSYGQQMGRLYKILQAPSGFDEAPFRKSIKEIAVSVTKNGP